MSFARSPKRELHYPIYGVPRCHGCIQPRTHTFACRGCSAYRVRVVTLVTGGAVELVLFYLRGSSLQSPHIRALLCLRLNRRFIKFKFPFNCHPEHKRPAQWTTNDTRYLTVDMMPQRRTSSSTHQLADQADGVKKTGWSTYSSKPAASMKS